VKFKKIFAPFSRTSLCRIGHAKAMKGANPLYLSQFSLASMNQSLLAEGFKVDREHPS